MKKIILSVGMMLALASAGYAQSNTTTINQSSGENNTLNIEQTGQNLNATINQTTATTIGNSAEIIQTGTGSNAVIVEKGKRNNVLIEQASTGATASHDANVNVAGNGSDDNIVTVTQAGKSMEADIDVQGDRNNLTLTQSNDKNRASVQLTTTALNDDNTVSITQMGQRGQAYANVDGDRNEVTVMQDGLDNRIGDIGAPGTTVTTTFAAGTPGPGSIIGVGAVAITANTGINIIGDDNTVSVTQEAGTKDNQVAIQLGGAGSDDNMATVNQLGTANGNTAIISVAAGSQDNEATINQSGIARNNSAAIDQQGYFDVATINQTGRGNNAVIQQLDATFVGTNTATINQPGTFNNAYVEQSGVNGSTATITQNKNQGTVAVFQRGDGGHTANITQNSNFSGARLVLLQNGFNNTTTLVQTDQNYNQAPDFELIQNGSNNTTTGINQSGAIRRITQTGNGNTFSY